MCRCFVVGDKSNNCKGNLAIINIHVASSPSGASRLVRLGGSIRAFRRLILYKLDDLS